MQELFAETLPLALATTQDQRIPTVAMLPKDLLKLLFGSGSIAKAAEGFPQIVASSDAVAGGSICYFLELFFGNFEVAGAIRVVGSEEPHLGAAASSRRGRTPALVGSSRLLVVSSTYLQQRGALVGRPKAPVLWEALASNLLIAHCLIETSRPREALNCPVQVFGGR
jgi:hypothetical protein